MNRAVARSLSLAVLLNFSMGLVAPIVGQVDSTLAHTYFREAATLCEREGGHLWGVSLCGPMVFADAATGAIAANRRTPDGPRPRTLGFANTAVEWGGVRWATYIWQLVPADDPHKRGRLMIHELFHRVQDQLGLMVLGGSNDHLDTLEGRYWLQLEWRALAASLRHSGSERAAALRDALAFRATRRDTFPTTSPNERVDEIREGLAQYTGTSVAVSSHDEAVASALAQLADASEQQTFVRTFAYPSGVAYGLLLDDLAPGWTRRVTAESDLGDILMMATGLQPAGDVMAAAARYGAVELRATEEEREQLRLIRVAELRRRFVEGPVLVLPRGRGATLVTTGATPIPGHGTVFFTYRVSGEWGSFETDTGVLVSQDGQTLTVPAPTTVTGNTITGEGWTIALEEGWSAHPGPRPGDYRVMRGQP